MHFDATLGDGAPALGGVIVIESGGGDRLGGAEQGNPAWVAGDAAQVGVSALAMSARAAAEAGSAVAGGFRRDGSFAAK